MDGMTQDSVVAQLTRASQTSSTISLILSESMTKGFSIGFVNGGYVNELSLIGTKKRSKDDVLMAAADKLRNLAHCFDGFDSKICNLKNNLRRGIEGKNITVADLENNIKVIESIEFSTLDCKSVVEGCIDSLSIENLEEDKLLNQKSSKRNKEVGGSGIDLLKIAGNFFQESSVNSKPNKIKDGNKNVLMHLEANNENLGNIFGSPIEEKMVFGAKSNYSENDDKYPGMVRESADKLADEIKFADEGDYDSGSYSYRCRRLRFVNSQRINMKMGPHNEVETLASNDNFLDSDNFHAHLKNIKPEAFGKGEQILGNSNGSHRPTSSMDYSENEIYKPHGEEEERASLNDNSNVANFPLGHNIDEGSSPSPSISDDIVFNRYLMEANALMKKAREYLRLKSDEEQVETLLYEAAKIFSKAIEVKPMSLLGVGQLGNTLLLHGELKLKRSRCLRALLAERYRMSITRHGEVLEGVDNPVGRRDRIASHLIRVCEECEGLLVEAGKRYRLALSIDGNDMRALYNWGLALSFRAQLIADIGPEAAVEADKVFLAAIDKFDAMMSKSNLYAPDALFRWGVALQQRSRLGARSKKEKVKLLQQAKQLYEDALRMDSDSTQVREALRSCVSELSFRSY